MSRLVRPVPPNFLAIPFGLAGLGIVWRAMQDAYGAPAAIPDALLILAAIVWVAVVTALLARGARRLAADVRDSVLSPFVALAFVVPIVLAGGVSSEAPSLAKDLFIAAVIPAALVGGSLTGQWIAGEVEQDKAHPGYFLPTVAGGFLAAQAAAHVGLRSLGMLSFGIGTGCWLILGSLILNRLVLRPTLPAPLVPTLAIEVAPPAPAGGANFALHGLRADTVSYALAGYAILMVLVQARLLPVYLRQRFGVGFWAFTFSWCAVVLLALRWIELEHPAAQRLLAWLACAAVSALVGGIAARTVLALRRGELLPARATRTDGGDRAPRSPVPGSGPTGTPIPAAVSRDA